VQYKEAEGSSFRDGSYGEPPGTPKVRSSHFFLLGIFPSIVLGLCWKLLTRVLCGGYQDRTFIPDSINFGGKTYYFCLPLLSNFLQNKIRETSSIYY
jgi:DNA methyltransferase 1-associated protein 1